jgi:phenylpropionate dioxygenase-like ring-hydroxylating dioxygenase large terminal subunit
MLTREENEVMCRVGPGTVMGAFMREYWVPVGLSRELPEADGAPLRVRILGEDLVAFRNSSGQIGMLAHSCPHRGASLFFGRNEEDGLRCVYHGWKFDVAGQCVDMPSEPAESNFKSKVRAIAYPCVERGGLIWAYMGPRDVPPPLPHLEANMLPEGEWSVNATLRNCNYFQALEGDIDTSHAQFLHHGSIRAQDARPGTFLYYRLNDRAPRYAVVDTPFGTMYGAYRPAEEDSNYWRIAVYLFPYFVIVPTGLLGHQVSMRAWVPMDDEHTLFITMSRRGLDRGERVREDGANQAAAYVPNTSGWLGRFNLAINAENDYLIDREKQRRKESFTGIQGVSQQDHAITESEGPIYDRSKEHLGTSDTMIVRTRRRLIDAARDFAATGATPPGVDDPEIFAVRGGGTIIGRDADWLAATEELRRAFVDHPELDPSIVG